MRAERFGSYSIDLTSAGTPSLSRLKSMRRKRRLWPPPRWREVMWPCALRPPVLRIGASSERSGVAFVISAKSETEEFLRPADVGLCPSIDLLAVFLAR